MIKHLLVPIDFSEDSDNAVQIASRIAKKYSARITLLHAYLIPGYSGGMAYETFIPPVDEHVSLINKQLDDFSMGHDHLKDIQVEKVAIPGSIQDVIGAYVEDNDVDLVVTATKGASGFKAFLLGTQSERIEEEVNCPVLVIPEGSDINPGDHLALAHDYRNILNQKQVEALEEFQKLYELKVHVVHVETEKDKLTVEEKVKDNLRSLNPTFHHVIEEDIEKGLNDFINKKEINLLSIVYHNHSFLNKIFGKSMSRQLTYHTKIPLLVLK